MKKLTIEPIANQVYLKIDEAKAGILDTSSRTSAVEYAEVVAVGSSVTSVKKGDKVFVKAWAIDTIQHEDTKYNFVNVETGGILAIVK